MAADKRDVACAMGFDLVTLDMALTFLRGGAGLVVQPVAPSTFFERTCLRTRSQLNPNRSDQTDTNSHLEDEDAPSY